jgi:DNA-binding HxlR family transcriptional regulator
VHFQTFYDAIKLCGHRWTFEIMTALQRQPLRFTELIRAIQPTPSSKSLNDALRRLQEHGLVCRPTDGEQPLYRLTAAGAHLLPHMTTFTENLQQWRETYCQQQMPQRCRCAE